jgi:hypothetical protein
MHSAENKSFIDTLLIELSKIQQGKIEGDSSKKIIEVLANCWNELEGANETSMEAFKLHRVENLSWNPPMLSFTIERHGGTVRGSTRAELHEWHVNVAAKTASYTQAGYRQLQRAAPRLDVKPIVERVCEAVQHGKVSDCGLVKEGILVWSSDRELSVNHGKLIPKTGPSQTAAGQRKRFRNELEARMKTIGWQLVSCQRSMRFQKS